MYQFDAKLVRARTNLIRELQLTPCASMRHRRVDASHPPNVDMTGSPLAIARALHRALEAGKSGAELRQLFTDDARTVEHPNRLKPGGAVTPLEQMLAASQAGAQLLSKQTYAVRHELEQGDLAILRLTWTGVIRSAVGPFREGQVLTAQIAQFIATRDGRIASIETFDCYEPF